MTFAEMLTAADKAAALVVELAGELEAAQAALEKATNAHAAAVEAETAAHAAITARLTEKGHHCTVAKDGTISVYQVNPDVETGWSAYHPVPGESA
jgi:sialic acid synthase SpsE